MQTDSKAPSPAAPEAAPGNGTRSMDRRSFLKISGAGVAGALFASSLFPARTLAQGSERSGSERSGSERSELMREFTDAAKEYGVPAGVLMAMGYVNTRWEMPPPELSAYEDGDPHGWGGYGVMALVQNPSTNTLAEAAELTGLSEEELKTDRAANIRGGAALLAESMGENKPQDPSQWFGAIAGGRGFGALGRGAEEFDAPSGVGGGELYAEQVFAALEEGVSGETKRGERISLQARPEIEGGE